jgi:hypothetical protein
MLREVVVQRENELLIELVAAADRPAHWVAGLAGLPLRSRWFGAGHWISYSGEQNGVLSTRTKTDKAVLKAQVKRAELPRRVRSHAFFAPGLCQAADACGGERAADALHRARIDPKLFGNNAHTGPARKRQGFADSLFERRGNRGPSEAFTFTPSARKPGTDSFSDHRPLKFGKNTHHLKHRLTRGRGGVEALLTQEEVDPERVQLGEEANQILQTAAQPMTMSNSRRAASRHNLSKAGRLSRPLAPLIPWSL